MTIHPGRIKQTAPGESNRKEDHMDSQTLENLEIHYRLSEWVTQQRDLAIRQHSESVTLLRYARALIEEPDRYSPENEALTEKGRRISPEDPYAVRFNVYGALRRAACVLNIRGLKLHDAQRSLANGASNTMDFMPRHNSRRTALAALDAAIVIQTENDRHEAMNAAKYPKDGSRIFCDIIALAAAPQQPRNDEENAESPHAELDGAPARC